MPEPDYVALERAYKETVVGKNPPVMMALNGKAMNAALKTDIYDSRLMYLVTRNGIQAITPETTDWL